MKELPKRPNDWITKSTKTVYDNQWISVDHNEVQNPCGGDSIYGVVHFKNIAIGIIPIDAGVSLRWWDNFVIRIMHTVGQFLQVEDPNKRSH